MIIFEYTCDQCQVVMRHEIRPRFYEITDDTRVAIQDRVVWCLTCRALQTGEVLPTAESIEQRREALERHQLEERDYRYLQMSGDTEAEYVKDQLKDSATALRWRQQRVAPPRCLECGSSDFIDIPMLFDAEGIEYYPHPDCGGKLVQTKGMFARADSFSLYDAEGNRLTD